jgi:hypothetical protein
LASPIVSYLNTDFSGSSTCGATLGPAWAIQIFNASLIVTAIALFTAIALIVLRQRLGWLALSFLAVASAEHLLLLFAHAAWAQAGTC